MVVQYLLDLTFGCNYKLYMIYMIFHPYALFDDIVVALPQNWRKIRS